MKTSISTFISVCLLSMSLCAQNQYHFGLLAGPNLAKQSVDDTSASYLFRPGFQFGFFGQIQYEQFTIQPEIKLAQLGSNILYSNQTYYTKLRYLIIPVILKYHINSAFSIEAGPQIGFLLCARSNFHPVTKTPYKEQVYTSAYKKTDFALSFGAGWASSKSLFIDLRYNLGLIDISNYPGVSATKNSNIELSVAYQIVHFTKEE